MSETKETDDKTASGSGKRKTLNLKRTVESGHVQQNFSHRRSKSVIVEKKKKRAIAAPGETPATPATPAAQDAEAPPKAAKAAPAGEGEKAAPRKEKAEEAKTAKPARSTRAGKATPGRARSGAPSSAGQGLSEQERAARAKALEGAKIRAVEEQALEQERAKQRAIEEKKAREEQLAREKQAAEEEAKLSAEQKAKRDEEQKQAAEAKSAPAKEKTGKESAAPKPQDNVVARTEKAALKPVKTALKPIDSKKEDDERKKQKVERATPRSKGGDRRVKGKLTITNALDDTQRERSLASLKRKRDRMKKQQMGSQEPQVKIAREVTIPETITIQELANRMAERGVEVIKLLMKQGQMYKQADIIDADTAQIIAEEFGHTVKRVSEADVEEGFIDIDDTDEERLPRAPIVTVMGHVDHGKTSLLDALREQDVVSGEAGGITQHIGAYQVKTSSGEMITFIDTPGHAAFTAMRARGAKVTDIVVLVVAGDDGVMPQTIEAINHARAAEVPLIVAINKMDKPDVDPNRVRTDLLQHEVIVESMSGETLEIEVSALKKMNLDKLLDAIAMQAELLELKANPNRSAEGIVVEAKLERGRGPVGTILVHRGTLRIGDIIVAGTGWGKVRAMINDHGEQITEAGPSVPVEVLGFDSAPEAGDQLAVVDSEARAREITEYRVRKRRQLQAAGSGAGRSLEEMMSQLQQTGTQEFPLVIKGDVQGSVEAIATALGQLGNDEVSARIVHSAVGGVTESDVALAAASNAVILGFNVRANAQARSVSEQDNIEIRYYSVIYDLIDDVKSAMSGMLSPELRETFLGNVEILEIFNISKVGRVAGCRVSEGKVERGANVRLIRDNVVIHEGKLSTLKRFKDEVKEVMSGQECGMAFENYQDMRAGDVIECFHVEEVERKL